MNITASLERRLLRIKSQQQAHRENLRSLKTDPLTARHWHNSADPVQAARIGSAAVKRARKAEKREEHANCHWHNNTAHDDRLALYPFSTYQ